jgi:hypothetical protein
MLTEFDQTTIANMTAALDYVCKKIPAAKDTNELRKRIADELMRSARAGRRSLIDLQNAGMKVLNETAPQRSKANAKGYTRGAIIAIVVAAVVVAAVGFSPPGHRLLNAMGLATACDTSDNC